MLKLIAILFLLSFIPISSWSMSNMPSAELAQLLDQPAPDFKLETTGDTIRTLSEARNGHAAILFFWATWCPHCHEEMERARQNLEGLKRSGIELVLVSIGEPKEDARAYLKHQEIPLESFIDEDNTVAGRYSVRGVPTLYWIDAKGVVKGSSHEFPTDYGSKFK